VSNFRFYRDAAAGGAADSADIRDPATRSLLCDGEGPQHADATEAEQPNTCGVPFSSEETYFEELQLCEEVGLFAFQPQGHSRYMSRLLVAVLRLVSVLWLMTCKVSPEDLYVGDRVFISRPQEGPLRDL
jgi:hypothetical protein